jgi:hypothetical protein
MECTLEGHVSASVGGRAPNVHYPLRRAKIHGVVAMDTVRLALVCVCGATRAFTANTVCAIILNSFCC